MIGSILPAKMPFPDTTCAHLFELAATSLTLPKKTRCLFGQPQKGCGKWPGSQLKGDAHYRRNKGGQLLSLPRLRRDSGSKQRTLEAAVTSTVSLLHSHAFSTDKSPSTHRLQYSWFARPTKHIYYFVSNPYCSKHFSNFFLNSGYSLFKIRCKLWSDYSKKQRQIKCLTLFYIISSFGNFQLLREKLKTRRFIEMYP